jgi:hypothetical protein
VIALLSVWDANAEESSTEINTSGNIYTAEFWEFDSRTGRRWNLDPKPIVGISQFSTFENNPIWFNDPLGDSSIPLMPRHPINKVSDLGYTPYNIIGGLVNGVQTAVNKAGDYLSSVSKADPVAGFNNQVNIDINAVKGAVASEINYYANRPNSQIVADTKQFFSTPDNYFKAAEQAVVLGATWKYGGGNSKTILSRSTTGTVLEGVVKSNYSRFLSKIPANSKSSATFQVLEDGNYLFSATSPGKVPGSNALYQKWVNPQGETFKMIKTTFAPDGSIMHVKPKF